MTTPSSLPALRDQLPRIITGLVLAAALITCLALGGAYLRVATALVSGLALFEFFQMFWPGPTKICSKVFGVFAGMMVFCPVGGGASVPVILALGLVWGGMTFLFDYGRGNDAARLEDHAVLPLGLAYIPVILSLALPLSVKEQFLVVAVPVVSDIAAYYVGCNFGKNKIWPRVSPKKSWQGSIGGFVAGVAAATVIACLPYAGLTLLGGNVLLWIVIGAVLAVAAQLGDFFESALKRSRNVKDSSEILPGHGGILDRIDSILFAVAAYSMVRLIIEHAHGLADLAASL